MFNYNAAFLVEHSTLDSEEWTAIQDCCSHVTNRTLQKP
jgi:hypothetical protein